jgi:Helix-turn-helix domain
MPNRRINSRRIKIHYSYTVEKAADTLGVHKNTVRLWIKQGLPVVEDERRPILLQGKAIRAFLDNRKAKRKRRILAGEFYCLKCREPKSPYAGIADYIATSADLGNLKGLCPVCEKIMNRRTSFAKLDRVKGNLDVKIYACTSTPKREGSPLPEL